MAKEEAYVTKFSTRVRQLILQYKTVKKENDDLYTLVDERDKEIAALKERVARLENDYNTLKTAKIIEVSDRDLDNTKRRVSKLMREVNQCITLLSEKQ